MSDKPLTVDQARELGLDLLRELSPHVGDLDAVNSTLSHWAEVLDYPRFEFVCMAALQSTFTDCLSLVPRTEVPAGGITYLDPEEAA
jgi:hypothetical protein